MDWPALFRGALWVAGLSIALAALSHLRWVAQRNAVPLRIAVSWDSFLAPFLAGLTLFAAGMAWGAGALWEKLAWALLAVAFAWQAAASARNLRAGSQEKGESHETH